MTTCHHCGKPIAHCRTWPDASRSYWAHPDASGGQTAGNAVMRQRCADGKTWATPARKKGGAS